MKHSSTKPLTAAVLTALTVTALTAASSHADDAKPAKKSVPMAAMGMGGASAVKAPKAGDVASAAEPASDRDVPAYDSASTRPDPVTAQPRAPKARNNSHVRWPMCPNPRKPTVAPCSELDCGMALS